MINQNRQEVGQVKVKGHPQANNNKSPLGQVPRNPEEAQEATMALPSVVAGAAGFQLEEAEEEGVVEVGMEIRSESHRVEVRSLT